MTRLQALKELALKVGAGEWCWQARIAAGLPDGIAYHAFEGSLDAAQALHEALLPGWEWYADSGELECYVWTVYKYGIVSHIGCGANAARAWLLAILNALITQEETNT